MQNQEFISPESFHQLSTWVEKDRNKNIWRSYRESASLTFYLNFPEKYQQIFCCLLKIQLKWKSIPAITCPHLGVWALTSYPPRTTSTPTPTHTHTPTTAIPLPTAGHREPDYSQKMPLSGGSHWGSGREERVLCGHYIVKYYSREF